MTVHRVYDLNCTLSISQFLNSIYLSDVIIKIYIYFEHHEFNIKVWNPFRKVKIVRLRICQRAFLNYGMHLWSSLNPEIKYSITAFHKMKKLQASMLFSSLN